MSSPAAYVRRACADGFGRLRGLRARRLSVGVLGLAFFFVVLHATAAVGQFPIRQVPTQWNNMPVRSAGRAGEAPEPSPRPLVGALPAQQPHPAIARITVPEKDGISYGSGTLIDVRGQFGLVVTNWHVVRDAAGTVTVEFPEGHKSAAHVVRTDPDWDLAALAVHRPKAEPLPITAEMPRVGEMLTIAGYGSGQYRSAAGPLSGLAAPRFGFPEEMLDLAAVEARQGDSGGPIINQRGEVCGVLFGSAPGYTIGSYGGRVRQFLGTVIPDGLPGSDTASAAGLAANKPPIGPPANALPGAPDPTATNPAWMARADGGPPKIDVPPQPQATALHQSPRYAAGLIDLEKTDPLVPARSAKQHDLIDAPVRDWPGEAGAVDSKVAVDQRLAANIPRQVIDESDDESATVGARIHASLPPRMGAGAAKGPGVDLNEAPPDQLLAAVWKRFGGATFFDQTKAVLAIIGVLAVVVQFWRFNSRSEERSDED